MYLIWYGMYLVSGCIQTIWYGMVCIWYQVVSRLSGMVISLYSDYRVCYGMYLVPGCIQTIWYGMYLVSSCIQTI